MNEVSDSISSRSNLPVRTDQENAVYQFIKRNFETTSYPFASSFTLADPFAVGGEGLTEIRDRVATKFSSLNQQPIEVLCEIETYGETKKRYSDLDSAVDRSGNIERVISFKLLVSSFTMEQNGTVSAGRICIHFRDNSSGRALSSHANDKISFEIEGTDESWVRDSEQEFRALLARFVLPEIQIMLSRFMKFTRPAGVVAASVAAFAISWIFEAFGILDLIDGQQAKQDRLVAVLGETSTRNAVNRLAEYVLDPIEPSFGWLLVALGLGISVFVFALVLWVKLDEWLGKIVPSSIIAIGDAGLSAQKDQDGWKSVVTIAIIPVLIGVIIAAGFFALDRAWK